MINKKTASIKCKYAQVSLVICPNLPVLFFSFTKEVCDILHQNGGY